MKNYPSILKNLVVNGLIAAGLVCVAWRVLLKSAQTAGNLGGLLIGFALLIAAAIFLAWPLTRLVAEPTGDLFYPERHPKKPPPMYGIPQSMVKRGEYEKAMAKYEEIVGTHPEEHRPYLDMMEIALVHLGDKERGSSVYRRGLRAFEDNDVKMLITQRYREFGAYRKTHDDRALPMEQIKRHGHPHAPQKAPAATGNLPFGLDSGTGAHGFPPVRRRKSGDSPPTPPPPRGPA